MDASTSTAIEAWITWAENRRGLRASSVLSYRATMVRLGEFCPKPIYDMELADLEAFQARKRGKSVDAPMPATLKREAAELRHFFSWLADRDMIPKDPTVLLEAPTVHNEQPKPITDDQWRRLWLSEMTSDERTMCGLAYFCGLRAAELAWLRPHQFVWEPKPLIANMIRKGGGKQTIPWVSFVALIADWNSALLPNPEKFITAVHESLTHREFILDSFRRAETVTPTVVSKRFKATAKRCGLDIHLHQLRHSFVTNQLRTQRVPIQEVSRNAGHKDIQTTMRYAATEEDFIGSRIDTVAILGWTPRAAAKQH